MTSVLRSVLLRRLLAVLGMALAGCGPMGQPEQGPEAVTRRFYELISASKTEGGASSAAEAFKLIDSRAANMNVHQFLEIIKRYPPDFKAEVGPAEVRGSHALVAIRFNMPSSFGGGYVVKQEVALNLDRAANAWKIDFTGETHGPGKEELSSAGRPGAAATPHK